MIEKIEQYAKDNKIPIMLPDGIEFLCNYIKENNIKRILEIGSAIGYSSIKMALVDKDITITTIEKDEKRYKEAIKNIKDFNFVKSILFGFVFSLSWTPCIGTFLSSALLLIANEKDLLKGIILILLYSIGLGIPFIVSVVLMEKLKNAFDFIKKNYSMVTKISGIILMLMGIYMFFN